MPRDRGPDAIREHDPENVIRNMGQGHPLRVEYEESGVVRHMWIPLWEGSPEVLNANEPSDDDSWMCVSAASADDAPEALPVGTPVADGGVPPVVVQASGSQVMTRKSNIHRK